MLRVSERNFYRQVEMELGRQQNSMFVANQMISSGKAVNQPSDNSLRSILAQHSHRQLEQVKQYNDCVDHAQSWIKQSDSKMNSMVEIFGRFKELANQMSTGTYSGEQREAISKEAQNLIDQLVTLANAELNGQHIFSGSRVDHPALQLTPETENPAVPDSTNTGTGGFYGQGTYRGRLSRKITLTVDAGYAGGVPSAANPMDVNVSYVDDFGRTITRQVTLSGTGSGNAVDIGDGVQVYAQNLSYSAGDSYTLMVGRHLGNEELLSVNLSWSNRMTYNYTMDRLFGSEGYSGGKWNNVMDMLVNWKDYLAWDSQEQDYFSAVPATYNNPTTNADLQVSGDWTTLKQMGFEFNVGGPVQSQSDDADLANYRNFQVDAAYAGGVPSATNPMTLHYEYYNGAVWVAQTVTITGVGHDNQFTLTGGVEIYLANASYSASDGPFQLTPVYSEGTTPSAANPLTMTYTYRDTDGTRRYQTVTFTGTGSANSQTLDPPGDITLTLGEDSTFDDFDAWDLSLEQYNQGQTKSQELLPDIVTITNRLLQYVADDGARLNRLETRKKLLEDDSLRLFDRLKVSEDTDISDVITKLKTLETQYQATLQATASISSRSLADYL